MTFALDLAARVAAVDYDALPRAIQERLRTCLLYNLVMGVTSAPDAVTAACRAASSSGPAATLASRQRLAPGDAAFVNAAMVCARGQNDTHPECVAHPGCITIPAVLALAQARNAAPRDVLAAMLAGYETLADVAIGAAEAVVKRGFRATSIFGVFAAAAGAARVLGLSVEQTAHALALATQAAAGTMQTWQEGSPEWRIQVAQSSRAGVQAALLAEGGMTAASAAFEGPKGFYAVFADGAQPAPRRAGWAIEAVQFKPFPGCLINQGPVWALLRVLKAHALPTEAVADIELVMSAVDAAYPGITRYGPFERTTEAVMSAPFMLAAALRDRVLLQKHFEREAASRELAELARRIRISVDESLPRWACRVVVTSTAGKRFEDRFTDPAEFVFGWDETLALLGALGNEWQLPGGNARFEQLVDAVTYFDGAPDLERLLAPVTLSA